MCAYFKLFSIVKMQVLKYNKIYVCFYLQTIFLIFINNTHRTGSLNFFTEIKQFL